MSTIFLTLSFNSPATYYFRIKKAKTRAIKVRVLLFGGDAGVVGASARCNSEMSVLAQANERQPGPAGSSGQNAHYTVGAPRILGKRKNGLNCPFCSFGGDAGS